MPVVTEVRCCDYHAAPIGDRAPIWWRGGDVKYWPRWERERAGVGERQGFQRVPRRVTMLREYLADALEHDHGQCEDASCDIAAAMANGFVVAAYHLLTGATEADACDNLVSAMETIHGVDAVAEIIGRDLYSCPDWEGWKAHHDEYARHCDACNGCTYAEYGWEPDSCAACGESLPVRDDEESET